MILNLGRVTFPMKICRLSSPVFLKTDTKREVLPSVKKTLGVYFSIPFQKYNYMSYSKIEYTQFLNYTQFSMWFTFWILHKISILGDKKKRAPKVSIVFWWPYFVSSKVNQMRVSWQAISYHTVSLWVKTKHTGHRSSSRWECHDKFPTRFNYSPRNDN